MASRAAHQERSPGRDKSSGWRPLPVTDEASKRPVRPNCITTNPLRWRRVKPAPSDGRCRGQHERADVGEPNKRHVQRLNHDAYRLGTCDVAADGSTLGSGGVLQRVRCAGTPQSVTGTVVQDMNSQGPELFGHRPRILSSDDIADAWKMSARLARLPAAGARADRVARGTGPVAVRIRSGCGLPG